MGAAISALPRAVGIVKRNPILIAGSVLFGFIALVGVAFSLIPLIGGIIFQVLILPVGLAGIVSMTDAGTDEGASLGDFTGGISDHAGSMIGAFGLMFLIQLATALALVVVLVFVIGFSIVGAAAESDPGAAFAGIGLLTGLVLLAVLLVVLVLQLVQQFLDVAVVVGGEDAAGALSEAASLVTGGPLSVALLVPAVLLMLVAFPLGVALGFAYHVAYYRERRPGAADPASDTGDGNADVVSPPSAGD
ncbi:hypothetical protein BRC84_01570 [Halobacteriales archaeon QS_1_68_44]|nr:MAG: hypothetical protein BRC84_01570 [Halobacteriales archaeon QS_1_68_44]